MKKGFILISISILITGIIITGCIFENHSTAPGNDPVQSLAKKAKAEADVGPSNGKAVVRIPDNAIQVAPNVFLIGSEVVDGKIVDGYAFIHYKDKRGNAKPTCNNDGICDAGEHPKKCGDCSGGGGGGEDPVPSTCFGFIAKGAKWKSIEPYMIDPANSEGLDPLDISVNTAADIQKWEDAANQDILGDEVSGTVDRASIGNTYNDQNEVIFGDVEDSDAIAVTIVWGIFGGAPRKRVIMEWDMVIDEVDFDWGMDGSPLVMDFENIMTHELGHSLGMGDLYEASCAEETMYGYGTEGETKKRDLAAGDIAGINELY